VHIVEVLCADCCAGMFRWIEKQNGVGRCCVACGYFLTEKKLCGVCSLFSMVGGGCGFHYGPVRQVSAVFLVDTTVFLTAFSLYFMIFVSHNGDDSHQSSVNIRLHVYSADGE
jgi:hypothetical protein